MLKKSLLRTSLSHLREAVKSGMVLTPARRITNIVPWPEKMIARAYKRIGREWELIEDAAMRAQGTPKFND
jgi:hypothetical protein